MVAFPPCKINLGLRIIRKRADGFHDIETCFYPLPFTDVLEIIPADKFQFSSSGINIPGREEDNLCVKAYHILKARHVIKPVHIHLHKIIPSGAGLGGGSADAAYTLRLLNALFELQLTQKQLMDYASALGSDCAFFIQDEPKIGKGKGEILEECSLRLSGRYMVLMKPDIHVSTAEAYAGIVPDERGISIKKIIEQHDVYQWPSGLINGFETSVFEKYPLIKKCKEFLYEHGASYASMSGSGSTVFGIFDTPPSWNEKTIPFPICWQGYLT